MEGHRLSPVEQQQAALSRDVESIRAWSEGHHDTFGGLWFVNDAAEAGVGPVVLTVATTADPELTTGQLAEVVEHLDLIRVVQCRWSYRELAELSEQIVEEVQDARDSDRQGSHITTVGVHEPSNVVEIGVSGRDSAFAGALKERYGADRVHVTLGIQPRAF